MTILSVEEMRAFLYPFNKPTNLGEYLTSLGLARNKPVWASLVDETGRELPDMTRKQAQFSFGSEGSVQWEAATVDVPDNNTASQTAYAAYSAREDSPLIKTDSSVIVSTGTQVVITPRADWCMPAFN